MIKTKRGRANTMTLAIVVFFSSCWNKNEKITYYKNGNKNEVYTFKDKKIEGWFYHYDSAIGYLKSKAFFENGEANGEFYRYFPDGKVMFKGANKNGNRDGIFRWYSVNGKDSMIGYYANDRRCGNWSEYYDNGNYKATYHVKNDTLDSLLTFYYPSGVIQIQFWCIHGKRGLIRMCDHNGKDSITGAWDLQGRHARGMENALE